MVIKESFYPRINRGSRCWLDCFKAIVIIINKKPKDNEIIVEGPRKVQLKIM